MKKRPIEILAPKYTSRCYRFEYYPYIYVTDRITRYAVSGEDEEVFRKYAEEFSLKGNPCIQYIMNIIMILFFKKKYGML